MSHTNNSLEQLMNGVYKAESLNGLMTIDMALDGKIVLQENKELLVEVEAEISDIIEKMMQSDLPEDVKMAIYRRLEQVKSTVSHYRFWGKGELKSSLEQLAGALIFNLQPCESKDKKKIIDRIGALFGRARKITEDADKVVEGIESISSRLGEHISTIEAIASSPNVAGE